MKVVSLDRVCVWSGGEATHSWLRLGFSIFSPTEFCSEGNLPGFLSLKSQVST